MEYFEKNNYKFEVKPYFYNPNIFPYEEYIKRLNAFIKATKIYETIPIIGDYDPHPFKKVFARFAREDEGGRRCECCIRLRLLKTAQQTKLKNYDAFSTTLLVSPKKSQEKIIDIGKDISETFSLSFIGENFRRGNTLIKARNLLDGSYFQDYCGCVYGLVNQRIKEIEKDESDLSDLLKLYPKAKKLWKYRSRELHIDILREYVSNDLKKIKQVISLIKPSSLIVEDNSVEKFDIESNWLKCSGYNCKIRRENELNYERRKNQKARKKA
ncbi:MAG: epoxyqueuosine reductase QueH [Kosmotoga sp.]|nr:MAG: epoxyqueuosine reductase QueH [Kosmotoga sp.]